MNVPGWALALLLASWLLWGAMCWVGGYTAASRRYRPRANDFAQMKSPRSKSDE